MSAGWLRNGVIALVLTQCVCAAGAFAQQTSSTSPNSQPPNPPSTIQLTLKQAVELALKQNPQRVIAKILLSESERTSQITRAPLLPQAGINGVWSLNQYNLQIVESQPRPVDAGPYQYLDVGPNFSQVLLNFPLIRAYQAGREGVKQSRADERTAREIAVLGTVNQFLLILQALANRDAAQSRVDLAQRLYEQATQLQKNGIGLNIDTTRANVELQNEKQNLIDADTATRTTKYQLAALLDLPRSQEVDVTDRLGFFDVPSMEKDALVTEALAARPELRSFDSQQRIAHLNTDAAGEQRLPQLDFSGFWHYQAKHWTDGVPGYTYAISLEFPLFTGGKIHAEEARAKLEEQRIAEARRQVEAQIVSDVKTAFDQLQAARSSVDVANLGLQLAQDEVAQAQRRFAAGVTTNVEVITAQDALARANDNQIAALYQFNISRALLARATGDIEAMYTK